MHRSVWFPLAFVIACATPLAGLRGANPISVTLEPGTEYQVLKGWGAVNSLPEFITPAFRQELLYEMVNEFGLNRLRYEIPAGNSISRRRWEWSNDNSDPNSTDWTQLNTAGFDKNFEEIVGPFRDLVEARGDPFNTYISPSFYPGGSSGEPPSWILWHDGEYAEYAMTMLMRLKYIHNMEADYYCILNEASYNNPFTLALVVDKVKVLGPIMEAAGLETKIEYPESLNAKIAWENFIVPTQNDDELWSWIGTTSYHRYGSTAESSLMRDWAWSKGITNAQTESGSLTLDRLYDDLTIGGCSYWEIYGMGSQVYLFDDAVHYNFLERKDWYWRFLLFSKYIRPGAQRIGVSSSDSALRALAWVKDGKYVVNLLNTSDSSSRAITLYGLPEGNYGLVSARLTAAAIEQGVKTVGANGQLDLTLAGSTLFTLYPLPAGNSPPYFTNFRPSVGYLVAPTSSFTLQSSAQDPEKNAISFQWALTKAPLGAEVQLATPTAANCVVSGLTVPGDYAFSVTASDATGSAQREVRMQVFPSNPAPVISSMHNRIPVILTLPTSSTSLRSATWNLDGDELTLTWSVLEQPPGANAQIAAPGDQNTTVSGMTVAGNYVFQLSVTDGTSTDVDQLTVPVYPANTAPTVSGSATPNALALPASTTVLNSTSADANGDELSHWWKLVSAPAGARPVFLTRSSPSTEVRGLVVPGSYVFQHLVTDESSYKFSSNITVTVTGTGEHLFLSTPAGGEMYEAGQDIVIRWTSGNFAGPVRLEFHDGSAWSDIIATTENDGMYKWTLPVADLGGCKVRVSDAADGLPSDESDSGFRIVKTRAFRVLDFAAHGGDSPVIQWSCQPGGRAYQVYYTDSLSPIDWEELGGIQTAAHGEREKTMTDDTAPPAGTRYYRVVEADSVYALSD